MDYYDDLEIVLGLLKRVSELKKLLLRAFLVLSIFLIGPYFLIIFHLKHDKRIQAHRVYSPLLFYLRIHAKAH